MSNLRNAIDRLSNQFAAGVVQAIRSASFEEIAGLSGAAKAAPVRRAPAAAAAAPAGRPAKRSRLGRGGRLRRRSKAALTAVLDSIVDLVARHPEGLRAEQIRAELGLASKELPRPMAAGLAARRLVKKGLKRATTYFVGSSGKASAKRAK